MKHLVETAVSLRESEPQQSDEFLSKALSLSKSISDNEGLAISLYEIGENKLLRNDLKSSLQNFIQAAHEFETCGQPDSVALSYRKQTDIHLKLNNFKDALESELNALRFAPRSGDKQLHADVHNKIGEILKNIGEYNSAIDHHLQALEIFEETGDRKQISLSCFHIGNCHNWNNELDSAYNYLDRSLALAEDLEEISLQVHPSGSLAILYTKLREYDKAQDYFFRAIDLVNLTGSMLLKTDLLKSLGSLFIETGKYDEALKFLTESLELAKKEGFSSPLSEIYKLIAVVHELNQNYKEALEYYKKHLIASGDLINQEIALKSKGLQLKYDLEELRNERDLAAKAVELKDQFIANLSHEIRTPLNGVIGMANLLSDTNPSPEQLEYINTIKLSSNNLIKIIDDLLEYSNIQDGNVEFESKEFRVQDTLAGIVQLYKAKANEKNIELTCTFDHGIPEVLIGDSARLNQILINLTSNALKFTDKGSVNINVRILESDHLNVKMLFTVTDTGCGIPEDMLEHIFQSFTQYTTTEDKLTSGTGLGLTIAKQLVDLQGGLIAVSSKVNQGSEFKVELPFKLKSPLRKGSGSGELKGSIPARNLSDITVLLVEDNKVNQFLAQRILTKMGFLVDIASSGKEAMNFLSAGNPCDVILMDVQMPEMNGYELTHMIRTTLEKPTSEIPIIALTAYASANEKEKARQAGMSEYVTKPYSPNELLSVIMKLTDTGLETGVENERKEISEKDIHNTTEKLVELFGGSNEDVLSLMQMLVVQIPQGLEEMSKNIKGSNWPAAFQAAHKLKSSLFLLKISSLNDMISELEEYTKDASETERIGPIFNEFSDLCRKTVSLLKSEIISLKKR